jgi:hypothetical protein
MKCPSQSHFHVVFEQVGSNKRPIKTINAESPHSALDQMLAILPLGWRGGVSVFDDDICHEDEMPVLHAYVGNQQ